MTETYQNDRAGQIPRGIVSGAPSKGGARRAPVTEKYAMTAQVPELLLFEGAQHALCGTPLESFFAAQGTRPALLVECSNCWRGYQGQWEIRNGKLFLLDVSGELADGREFTTDALFPGSEGPIFAGWYSGRLRCPQGELLAYVHQGFESIHEQDLLIQICDGFVMGQATRTNQLLPDHEGWTP